jgi:IS5 family transposase
MKIWKQFREKGITIKNGTIQDATFIESDPGHGKRKKGGGTIPIEPIFPVNETTGTKQSETGKDQKKARKEERKNAETRRSKEGTWAVKNRKAHFGYKLHTIQDADNDMIINYSTTTASVHDSQIDLSIPGIVATRIKVTLALKEEG